MTWATLTSTGRGRLVLWLEVAGIPYVFGTDALTPAAGSSRDGGATDWYADAGFLGVLPVMKWSGISYAERASFLDGTLEVDPIEITLVDHRGSVTALFASWLSRSMTRLVTSLTAAAATVGVDSVAAFPAGGGVVWIGEECIRYDHTDAGADELHLCTRGYYGTIARAHLVDLDARPVPLAPAVLDGPQSMTGRRCYLHAATVSDLGVVSASTCIYRGHIRPGCEPAEGEYQFSIDHIATYFSRQVCSRDVSTTLWAGYWYAGLGGDGSLSRSQIVLCGDDGLVIGGAEILPAILGGWYGSVDELMEAWNAEVDTETIAAAVINPWWDRLWQVFYSAGGVVTLGCSTSAVTRSWLRVVDGDVLWALGFDAGTYHAEIDQAPRYEAQNPPRAFVCELPLPGTATAGPTIYGDETTRFPEASYVILGGAGPYLRVGSGGGTGTALPIDVVGYDSWFFDSHIRGGRYIAVESESDLQIRSCMVLSHADPQYAIERCFGLDPTDGTPADLVVTGLEDYDFRWSELTEARRGLDQRLVGYHDCVTTPTSVAGLLCDRLGMVGIVPRLTSDGRIGWVRLRTPCAVDAEAVEIDDQLWSIVEAARVRTILEGEPLLNHLAVRHSFDYTAKEFSGTEAKIDFEDGRGCLAKVFGRTYEGRGLHIRPGTNPEGWFQSSAQLAEVLAGVALGTHFGLFGRIAPLVDIPCTYGAKRLLLGDIVLITHPCVVDIGAGVVGVDEELGVVVGATRAITDDSPDHLIVMIPQSEAWPIAPCCHATAWNAGLLQLTIAATEFAQTGEDDMTYFAAGQVLRFQTRDSTVDLGVGTGTIAAGGVNIPARTITLVADPFGGAFPAGGVLVFFADWDEATATGQHDWLFECDSAYGLGAAPDPGQRWGA